MTTEAYLQLDANEMTTNDVVAAEGCAPEDIHAHQHQILNAFTMGVQRGYRHGDDPRYWAQKVLEMSPKQAFQEGEKIAKDLEQRNPIV